MSKYPLFCFFNNFILNLVLFLHSLFKYEHKSTIHESPPSLLALICNVLYCLCLCNEAQLKKSKQNDENENLYSEYPSPDVVFMIIFFKDGKSDNK